MKTKLLLYCTKGKAYLFNRIIKGESDGYYTDIVPYDIEDEYLCGKIVAECECEVEEAFYQKAQSENELNSILKDSCLTDEQLWNYVQNGTMNLLHLANIKAFEKPLELKECKTYKKFYNSKNTYNIVEKVLTNAPQNMCWVWYNGQKYCLISIRPEWLCKILNGEKTIEVRRKVLKGMM